jgi:hypothetical protein
MGIGINLRGCSDFGRLPVPWQQGVELLNGKVGDTGEDVGEPGLRVDVVQLACDNQGVQGCGALATPVGAGEEPGFAAKGYPAQGPFCGIVRDADPPVVEEAGKCDPALETVVHRFGDFVVARQTCALGAHPDFEIGDHRGALLLPCGFAGGNVQAVDRAFDVEQGVDLADSLQRQRRDGRWCSVRRPSPGAGFDIGQHEELAPGMAPAGGFEDRPGTSVRFVQLAVSAIGVSLQDAAIVRQMALGMFTGSVARVIEHRRWWVLAPEGSIVPNVGPQARRIGLAPGEHGDCRVVAMYTFGAKDVSLDAFEYRREDPDAGADLVGERRQAQRHTFSGIAFGLTVEGLMLAELLEDDHCQKTGAGPAARNDMERRWRLGDALTVPACELLADVLDDLPLPGNDFERLGVTSSPSFDSRDDPQHAQAVGPGTMMRSRGKCSGKGLRAGRLRVKADTCVVPALAVVCSAARSSSLAEVSSSSSCSSIWSISRAVRSERVP